MINLTVDKKVLEALKTAFPKPAASAERALNKYINVLEQMLFDSLQYEQTLQNKKLGLYSISLQQLANRGGQIGPKKVRLHSWLKANNLELVETVVTGSKFTGLVSQIKPTSLVSLTNTLERDLNILQNDITNEELDQFLLGDEKSNWALFELLYPDYKFTLPDDKTANVFDKLPVNIISLKGYIDWLANEAKHISQANNDTYLRQALTILGVASVNDGVYLQRKKPSKFGRMYYQGVSVQNINKELRRAVLGNCWEYDIRSSVVAWKMGFAKEYLESIGSDDSVNKAFSASINYLEDKTDFMATVRHLTFTTESKVPKDMQLPLLKQAFTALSFGARLTTNGWVDNSGNWTNPAISTILKNPHDRNRFINDSVVKAFIEEQKTLDTYLYEGVKKYEPSILNRPELHTESCRPSRSKVLALMYQHR